MSDWSSDAAARLQNKRREELVLAEAKNNDNLLLSNAAHRLWNDLKNTIKSMCDDLDKEPGMQGTLKPALNSQAASVTVAESGDTTRLKFEGAQRLISISEPVSKIYTVKLPKGSREPQLVDNNDIPQSVDEIAKDLLNTLLGI